MTLDDLHICLLCPTQIADFHRIVGIPVKNWADDTTVLSWAEVTVLV
jgi:hypothetical protein